MADLDLTLAAGRHYPAVLANGLGLALLAVLAAAVLWLAVDARPLIGLLVAVLLDRLGLVASAPAWSVGYMLLGLALWLLAATVLATPAIWRLHRQTARPGRTTA